MLIHHQGQREGFHAPSQIITEPGYQMVVYAVTDAIAQTVHPNPTDERDIAKLESDIFEPKEDLIERGAHVMERVLYRQMLGELGIDENALRPLIENEADQIPFPGEYPVSVASSLIQGLGLITTQDIPAQSLIAPARIQGKRTPAGRYINHGSQPNARMRRNAEGDIEVIALMNIPQGAEVLVDYREAFKVSHE